MCVVISPDACTQINETLHVSLEGVVLESYGGIPRTAPKGRREQHTGDCQRSVYRSHVIGSSPFTKRLRIQPVSAPFRPTFVSKPRLGDQSALCIVAGVVPPSIPPPGAVRWLRPSEVSRGDQAVLFVGNVPGDCRIVAGQVTTMVRALIISTEYCGDLL